MNSCHQTGVDIWEYNSISGIQFNFYRFQTCCLPSLQLYRAGGGVAARQRRAWLPGGVTGSARWTGGAGDGERAAGAEDKGQQRRRRASRPLGRR